MQPTDFYPETEEQLKNILTQARSQNIPVQPYAGGFNWGYGETDTQSSRTWKIHFSKMRKIISFDQDLGTLRIQPGVTQGDLEDYLKKNNLNYYVPNTGAGRRGSLLGNALERGFGIAPIQDHANSLLAIQGYLADGSVYKSTLKWVDETLSECFAWGVGPQIDSLATQSSVIFISEVTIQLVPKAPHTDLLIASFSDHELPATIEVLRTLLQTNSGAIGSIKIFHKNQVLKISDKKDWLLKAFLKKKENWFLLIVVYSNSYTRSGSLKSIRYGFKNLPSLSIRRMNRHRIDLINRILKILPFNCLTQFRTSFYDLSEFLSLAEGFTSEIGYKALNPNFNPIVDSVFQMKDFTQKLAWLSPLCPMKADRVERLLDLIQDCKAKAPCEFKTLTWTVLNSKTLALVIPLIFDPNKENEFWDFFRELHYILKENGFIPYRFHTKMMSFLVNELLPQPFKVSRKIKKALDPEDLLIPERY